ncbi:MAG: sulfite exporter TauE/SafE family protein [Planctomycetes bacterium]|jgi:uncharacterized membrane protein YfcA|nr:sulfite exporter TauE/SafE family protein [Planctomycetota bacterium]
MILEPWQWALGLLCACMNGVAKTGVPGLGILVVPLMLYVVTDPRLSPGVVLPLLCLADLFAVVYYRRHAQWDRVLKLVPWVAVGLGFGMVGLWAQLRYDISEVVLTQTIGVIVLVMIILQLVRKWKQTDEAVPTTASSVKAALYGSGTGFATYIANAAGPVMNLYLLSMTLPKREFMGTAAWFFFVINLVKVPQFIMQERITAETLVLDLWLAPAVIVGAFLGRWLFTRIPQALFEQIIIGLAFVATIALFLR